MNIVTRAQSGLRPPKARQPMQLPSPRLWIHHTATAQHGAGGVRAIQAFHMDTKRWVDIAYSFLVDDDGTIFEGRGAGVAGAHTEGDNSKSHAICAMGNYEQRQPPRPMIEAIARLAAHGRDAGWWGDITGGHRDAPNASTACPGRHLYVLIAELRALANYNPIGADMPPLLVKGDAEPHWWITDGFARRYTPVLDVATIARWRSLGLLRAGPNDSPVVLRQRDLESIPKTLS